MKFARKVLFILSSASLFALAGCSFELGGEGTFKYEGGDREGAKTVMNLFFEKTAEDTNQVITFKQDGEVYATETIDGDKDSYVQSESERTFAFKNAAGKGVAAREFDDEKIYCVDDEAYESYYRTYVDKIYALLTFEDTEEYEYSFVMEGTEVISKGPYKGEATLVGSVKIEEGMRLDVTGNWKDGYATDLTVTTTETGSVRTDAFSFAYGSASVTIPDLSTWEERPMNL